MFLPSTPLNEFEGMCRRIELNPRSDENIVADDNLPRIKNNAVEVKKDVIPKPNVLAEVAIERRLYDHSASHST